MKDKLANYLTNTKPNFPNSKPKKPQPFPNSSPTDKKPSITSTNTKCKSNVSTAPFFSWNKLPTKTSARNRKFMINFNKVKTKSNS